MFINTAPIVRSLFRQHLTCATSFILFTLLICYNTESKKIVKDSSSFLLLSESSSLQLTTWDFLFFFNVLAHSAWICLKPSHSLHWIPSVILTAVSKFVHSASSSVLKIDEDCWPTSSIQLSWISQTSWPSRQSIQTCPHYSHVPETSAFRPTLLTFFSWSFSWRFICLHSKNPSWIVVFLVYLYWAYS